MLLHELTWGQFLIHFLAGPAAHLVLLISRPMPRKGRSSLSRNRRGASLFARLAGISVDCANICAHDIWIPVRPCGLPAIQAVLQVHGSTSSNAEVGSVKHADKGTASEDVVATAIPPPCFLFLPSFVDLPFASGPLVKLSHDLWGYSLVSWLATEYDKRITFWAAWRGLSFRERPQAFGPR